MSEQRDHDAVHTEDLPEPLEGEELDKEPGPGEMPGEPDVQAERQEGHQDDLGTEGTGG